jgi:hypothetical protein
MVFIRDMHLARRCRHHNLDDLSDAIEKGTEPTEFPKLLKVNVPELEGRVYFGGIISGPGGVPCYDLQDARMVRKTLWPDYPDDEIFKDPHPQFRQSQVMSIANGAVLAIPEIVEEVDDPDFWKPKDRKPVELDVFIEEMKKTGILRAVLVYKSGIWLLLEDRAYGHSGQLLSYLMDLLQNLGVFKTDSLINLKGHDDSESKFHQRKGRAQKVIIIDRRLEE